ncbi:MAG TPA: ATP-dependent Clp protease adaptor ClpS [Thermoflexales bacterium]|nr:ATP-dependent Clp protease adaptor ClpS [Thermoflexales bacterium]HQW36159.1 ATP-dependent Clp protease adaptor ClpS [Thermoflexales bacterium]HQX76400.1 ATP-dependent Clp protease adaptor ClpS [Thermoflexales bacterium]HQZ21735.1 ATP-dependent Clp protease adaptor ClpS [Thermoflexales bacterium]HQZ99969.1 ATP-dependent Clp protease adaptor ClpS [Thermoflexales bacterium]
MAPVKPAPANPEIEVKTIFDRMVVVEPLWRVWIHNDDVTTFEFVIRILMNVFGLNSEDAELLAWITHTQDVALVGAWPKNEALERINKATFAARLENFPLQFSAEPDE